MLKKRDEAGGATARTECGDLERRRFSAREDAAIAIDVQRRSLKTTTHLQYSSEISEGFVGLKRGSQFRLYCGEWKDHVETTRDARNVLENEKSNWA